jgi:hypothetical protein
VNSSTDIKFFGAWIPRSKPNAATQLVLTTFHNKPSPLNYPTMAPYHNSEAYFNNTTRTPTLLFPNITLHFHFKNSQPSHPLPIKQNSKMATPKHSISAVEKANLPTLATLVAASKLSLTINRLLFKDWPNHAAQKPLYTGAVEGGFADPSVTNLKVVDNGSGEIVGYLGLTRKRPAPVPAKKEGERGDGEKKREGEEEERGVPFGIVPEVLKEVGRMVAEVAEGNPVKGMDYYGLSLPFPLSRRCLTNL